MDKYGSACTVHPERCQQYLGRPGEGFLPQWTPALILLVYAIVIAASVHLPFWANKSSSPQYLSSSGLPIELTRTGMVNVFLVMLIAINMPFFLAMLSSTPCETALGGCNSISCVCANYLLPFGYVFMFVCLLYGSLLLVRMLREMRPRSWKEMVEDGCWGCFMSAVKVILALACFGPTLTAIFPALETTYVTDPYAKEHYWGNTLHGVGVTVFPLVLTLITFVWYVGHHAYKARGSAPVPFPKRGAFARLAFILLTRLASASRYRSTPQASHAEAFLPVRQERVAQRRHDRHHERISELQGPQLQPVHDQAIRVGSAAAEPFAAQTAVAGADR